MSPSPPDEAGVDDGADAATSLARATPKDDASDTTDSEEAELPWQPWFEPRTALDPRAAAASTEDLQTDPGQLAEASIGTQMASPTTVGPATDKAAPLSLDGPPAAPGEAHLGAETDAGTGQDAGDTQGQAHASTLVANTWPGALDAASGQALTPTAIAPGLGVAGGASPAVDVPPRQVAPPLHSPDFAPALGAQLNLMVRDGVSEARLHLNPAEMGPISVQIRILGQQARVEMTAEQAGTRQVLEQAMPTLAHALRESGLTLTGGGVFEQPRDAREFAQSGGDGGAGRGGRPSGGLGDTTLDLGESELSRPVAMPRGMLDLYA